MDHRTHGDGALVTISVSDAVTPTLPDGVMARLEAAVRAALAEPAKHRRADQGHDATVHLSLIDRREMRRLNRDYHATDAPTDVLAFDLSDPDAPLEGDLYLCVDVAREAAAEAGCGLDEELVRLAVHGTLHLGGHDHPLGPDRWESGMFRVQERIVARLADSKASDSC